MLKLGERLMQVASFVPSGAKLADIGTDHAYLPIYLVHHNKIAYAVAGEVNQGPYQAAQDAIESYGLAEKISLRLGNGLEILKPAEVDTVSIAGMGGGTVADILAKSPDITCSLQRIIIQPMNGAALIREWLMTHGWVICDEALVKEDGRLYEIIVAERGWAAEIDSILYDVGPVIWLKRLPLLKEHIEHLLFQHKRVLMEMDASPNAKLSSKYYSYVQKIKDLELKLACL